MKNEQSNDKLKNLDRRLVDKLIRSGELDAEEYQRYLKGLPDEESKVKYIEVFEEKLLDEVTPLATDSLTFTSV